MLCEPLHLTRILSLGSVLFIGEMIMYLSHRAFLAARLRRFETGRPVDQFATHPDWRERLYRGYNLSNCFQYFSALVWVGFWLGPFLFFMRFFEAHGFPSIIVAGKDITGLSIAFIPMTLSLILWQLLRRRLLPFWSAVPFWCAVCCGIYLLQGGCLISDDFLFLWPSFICAFLIADFARLWQRLYPYERKITA